VCRADCREIEKGIVNVEQRIAIDGNAPRDPENQQQQNTSYVSKVPGQVERGTCESPLAFWFSIASMLCAVHIRTPFEI
jgi:hypothetical protein